mmetsp:Transcript_5848/g.10219  ORF Transcript_5848/g.10219 Transcript_5848/m.10219 type:complete len:571 (+) Transcript_5848:197-1909(+)
MVSQVEKQIAQLQEFYRSLDPSKVKNVEPMFEKWSFEEISAAVKAKYGKVPSEWESFAGKAKRRESKARTLLRKMSGKQKNKPAPTIAKPQKPVPPAPPPKNTKPSITAGSQKPGATVPFSPIMANAAKEVKPAPPKPRPVSSRAPLQIPAGKPPPPSPSTKPSMSKPTMPTPPKKPVAPPRKPSSKAEATSLSANKNALAGKLGALHKPAAPAAPAASDLNANKNALAGKLGGLHKAPPAAAAPAGGSGLKKIPEDHADMGKYKRMQKSGLPQGAIENAMQRDGIDPSSLFGSSTVSAPPLAGGIKKPYRDPNAAPKPKPKAGGGGGLSLMEEMKLRQNKRNGGGGPAKPAAPPRKPSKKAAPASSSGTASSIKSKQAALAGIFGGPAPVKSSSPATSKPAAKKWPTVSVEEGSSKPESAPAKPMPMPVKPKLPTPPVAVVDTPSKPHPQPSPISQQKSHPPSQQEKWTAVWSDEYKTHYYYNVETGATTWEPPAGVAVGDNAAPRMLQQSKYGQVMYDFKPTGYNQEEIAVARGTVVQIIDEGADGWTTGYTEDGRFGLFPSSYVQVQ